jgi:hypothetical protein
MVPPPMREVAIETQDQHSPVTAAEAMAVGAGAAVAAGVGVAAAKARPRRGIMLAGGAIAVAVIGLGGLALLGGNKGSRTASGPVPVIEARTGVSKERPANPGGVEVPNQDKEVLQSRPSEPSQAVRVAPREEQPVDLTQAQRQAAAAPGPVPGVRQIPGVPIGPVGSPAPTASAAPEPAPRPVASVPIVIAGQPSAAPQASQPPAPVAPAPAVTSPAASAAASAPTSVASAPTLAAPPPRVSGTATSPAAPAPASAAAAAPASEPRRVRSVPIRTDNGEAAPQRAQPQPRVVPPAAQAAAPADPTGPLSITPQANRGPAPAPIRQAAAPQGVVPSSVPSLAEQAPADPAPTRAESGSSAGSGFAVQLAAEGSESAARDKFNRMRGQYGSVLGGTSPSIVNAEVNGRNVYRVRVGNLSREDAVRMCERLKSSGGSCFVARN